MSEGWEMNKVTIKYQPPRSYIKEAPANGLSWYVECGDKRLRERGNEILHLDPVLPMSEVIEWVLNRHGNFLCPNCGEELGFNGSNGAGTVSLRCKKCGLRPSIYNTFELLLMKYKKILFGISLYFFTPTSLNKCGEIVGLDGGLLTEVILNIGNRNYEKNGKPVIIEYEGEKIIVFTCDMMYKGQKGLMLGVSGDFEVGVLGNESTRDGLEEFFKFVDERIKEYPVDRYMFVVDGKTNVMKRILERYGKKAIIVSQIHSRWGDVYVYFYKDDDWWTLRIRTDVFTTAGKKRNEKDLLAPGEVELYKGLVYISPETELKETATEILRNECEELIKQLDNVNWEQKGRIDIVMGSKVSTLNQILKELKRRKENIERYTMKLGSVIENISRKYQQRPGKRIKKNIINALKPLKIMRDKVNDLSVNLLKENIKEDIKKRGRKLPPSKIRISSKGVLVYRGGLKNHTLPSHGKWIIGLLRRVFGGKEITTNVCEGRFGNIGMIYRAGRSITHERAITKITFQNMPFDEVLTTLTQEYPMENMGKRGERKSASRVRIIPGEMYEIVYISKSGDTTERTIEVKETTKKEVTAYCYKRKDIRTFRRSRIKKIVKINPIGDSRVNRCR